MLSRLSWNPGLQSHLNPPLVLMHSCWQVCVSTVHSSTSKQDLPSPDTTYPFLQVHSKEPMVFWHSWSQLSVLVAHSLISVGWRANWHTCFHQCLFTLPVHVCWSELSWKPTLQLQIKLPAVLVQMCWQLPRPKVPHSSISTQFLPSSDNKYPSLQSQLNEPRLLLHSWEQFPLAVSHSLTSML